MKKIPKILTITFLSIFIFQMVCLILLLAIPQKSQAAEAKFTPQISIGGSDFQKGVEMTPSIAKYIQAIYNYAMGIVGILAAVVLMFGGVLWLTAGGSSDRINEAKAWIGAALSGLILALCSYMILNTINPDLVNLRELIPPKIEKSESCCCEGDGRAWTTEKKDCQPPAIFYENKIPNSPDNTKCLERTIEKISRETCEIMAGYIWVNEECILDKNYAKCRLTKEEKTWKASCCRKESEYAYAFLPMNQTCSYVCGNGWVTVEISLCEYNLEY